MKEEYWKYTIYICQLFPIILFFLTIWIWIHHKIQNIFSLRSRVYILCISIIYWQSVYLVSNWRELASLLGSNTLVRSDMMSRSVIDSIGTPGIYVNYKLGYNKSELALKNHIKPRGKCFIKNHSRWFISSK